MGTWVEFWKESVKKEDAMRNKWSDTYGADFKLKKHRNLPSITGEGVETNTSLTGLPNASRFSNYNGVSKLSLTHPEPHSSSPTNMHRTASNGGYYQHSTHVGGGNPTYGKYGTSMGYDPTGELPRIIQKSPFVSLPQPPRPAAGSAGHSPKNGHYVNGRVYATASHKSMMQRHEMQMQREAGRPAWFRDTI